MQKLVDTETEVNELNEKLKAHEDEFLEAEREIKDYEAKCKSLVDTLDRLRRSRDHHRDMVKKVRRKHAEESAELERKHAEEVATSTEESAVFVKNHEAVTTEMIHKERQKSAALIAKHAEEITALNNRAKHMRAKNAEDWDELLTKYVESQKKVAKIKLAYVSHKAARQCQIEFVKVGEKKSEARD